MDSMEFSKGNLRESAVYVREVEDLALLTLKGEMEASVEVALVQTVPALAEVEADTRVAAEAITTVRGVLAEAVVVMEIL